MKKLFTFAFALFASASLMAQIYVNETFESGSMPAGWSQTSLATDGGWLFGTASDLGSTYWTPDDNGGKFAATNDDNCDCDKSSDRLAMPAIDVSGASALYLSLDANFGGFTYGYTETAWVEYSNDGGTTWEVAGEIAGSGDNTWNSQSWDLSGLVGGSNLIVAIRYNDGTGWLYGLGIDNVKLYSSLPGDNVKLDASIGGGKYNLTGGNVPVEYTITNVGGNNITAVDVTWTDGTSSYTDNLSGLNIAPGASVNYTHGTAVEITDAVKYVIDVTAENPNGVADSDDSDNDVSLATFGISFAGTKRVIAEEATGTWCGWCPRGFVFMEQLGTDYPETFIGIAVHNGDPMTVAAYDNGETSFPGFTGFPSVVFDRAEIVDPSDMPAAYNNYINDIVPADVVVSVADFDPVSRELSMNAKVTFATQMSASDYRLNVMLVEDGVTGTGSGYNQANYYAGGGAGTMGGWESLPGTVPAADMIYDDVARDILGGWAGFPGATAVVAGDQVVWEDTYTVPADWDESNLEVVFTLIDGQTGAFITGATKMVGEPSAVEEIEALTDVRVTPNPTSGVAELQLNFTEAVDVNISVLNAIGQTVYTADYNNTLGDRYQLDLSNQASGVYHVRVVVDGQIHTERLVLQH
ncbi:MAG: Omp28-related outer membrane protein [Saprospiraceae bacterium]|nr:Omp28-related outer membrane protein [Saprospiraceae bacterium]